jgi:protein-disulfide isomerase-like protein with CxxC motif
MIHFEEAQDRPEAVLRVSELRPGATGFLYYPPAEPTGFPVLIVDQNGTLSAIGLGGKQNEWWSSKTRVRFVPAEFTLRVREEDAK